MKLVKPSIKLIKQGETVDDMYKHIEYVIAEKLEPLSDAETTSLLSAMIFSNFLASLVASSIFAFNLFILLLHQDKI